MPIVAKKAGGQAYQQLLGTTMGALVFSIVLTLITAPHFVPFEFAISFCSGIFWGFGQLFQFKGFEQDDISKVMPVSTATQLLFTTVASGVILHEWKTTRDSLVSLLGLVVMVVGIFIINWSSEKSTRLKMETIAIVCLSSAFLCLYVTTTNFFGISGFSIMLPQALGMICVAVILALKNGLKPSSPIAFNGFTGISWAIANVSLFYISTKVGVGISYTLSQLCVFVTVVGALIFLKEKKSRPEQIKLLVGAALFLVALFITSSVK